MQTRRGFMAGAAAVCGALVGGLHKALGAERATLPVFHDTAIRPKKTEVTPHLNGQELKDCFEVMTGDVGWAKVFDIHEAPIKGSRVSKRMVFGRVELRTAPGNELVYGIRRDGSAITDRRLAHERVTDIGVFARDLEERMKERERQTKIDLGIRQRQVEVTEFRDGR